MSLTASTGRISPAATDVLSVWGTSAATGPIIVQRSTWAMEPFATAERADTDGADAAGGSPAPTQAA